MLCQCPDHKVQHEKHIPCTNQANNYYLNTKTREVKALCGDCIWDVHVWYRNIEEEKVEENENN